MFVCFVNIRIFLIKRFAKITTLFILAAVENYFLTDVGQCMVSTCNVWSILLIWQSIIFNDILHMSCLARTHVFKAYAAYTTAEI